ncbi:unnamed protein product [Urochloa humidicola]
MIKPFKKATRGFDHILVAIDKFTKWIEVKPIKKHMAAKTIEFLKEITHCFGGPSRIITDNATNFTAYEFKDCAQSAASSSASRLSRILGPIVRLSTSTMPYSM